MTDLYGLRKVHFVGIGGVSMAAIAMVLQESGALVTGSDSEESPTVGALRDSGIAVSIGHSAEHVGDADAVIYTAAIRLDNPELNAARLKGLPLLTRGEALQLLVADARTIAVTGTHGKTTTSGMVATILSEAGLAPMNLVGGDVAGFESRAVSRKGRGEMAVVEACEAYGSFLFLKPAVAVITNIDIDHLDHYGDVESLHQAFADFVSGVTETAIVCADDPIAVRVAQHSNRILYGTRDEAYVRAVNIANDVKSTRFDLQVDGSVVGSVAMPVSGVHNVVNATGAAAACIALGVPVSEVIKGLEAFKGVARRFEHRGSVNGVDLIDDYAHLPAEIEAGLTAVRQGPWERVVAIFQPHLFTRTRDLAADFGRALMNADIVVLTDIYGAREQPLPGVSGKVVLEALCEYDPNKRVAYLPRLEDVPSYIKEVARAGDVVITMGAGDIARLPTLIKEGLL
ncbi:MAG: UDP-N-acetylmuramate--L-alanine ligase [Actinomycetota bacterium]